MTADSGSSCIGGRRALQSSAAPVHVRKLASALARVVVDGVCVHHDPAVTWNCAVAESGDVALKNVYSFADLRQIALFQNTNVFLFCGVVRRVVSTGLIKQHDTIDLVRFKEI